MQRKIGLSPAEQEIRITDLLPTGGDTDKAIRAALNFINRPVGMFTIYGEYGNGKTTLLMAMVNECRLVGVSAIYATAYDLAQYVQAGMAKDASTDAHERLEELKRVDLLAVDEWDKAYETPWYQALETNLFDQRYRDSINGQTGTLFAMNKAPEDFLPAPTIDRIRHRFFTVIQNNDPSRRRG